MNAPPAAAKVVSHGDFSQALALGCRDAGKPPAFSEMACESGGNQREKGVANTPFSRFHPLDPQARFRAGFCVYGLRHATQRELRRKQIDIGFQRFITLQQCFDLPDGMQNHGVITVEAAAYLGQ